MSAAPEIADGAAPDSRGGRVAVVAAELVGAPGVLDVLAHAGYGVIALPATPNPTLLRCAVIDAHQYAARGYAVRKVGVHREDVRGECDDDGLHRSEWNALARALRLTALAVPECLVSVDSGPEPLDHLRKFLNS
ncbi:hypothetical protein [Streptomyces pseudovenezuelae]|uniref:Uncharacterized protein n=1 Tax=Streptomyces pseudovenezuelae TaxID=67350 RepID=A0ABT6LR14_9ACTN|nr:hypothetical protein [Streptomyces pseudovenezuelae]MDH6217814.1 hypothetical protein [Streptomyces pseudovenezuelae]